MLMMTPDGRATDWNELPLMMSAGDLAAFLGGVSIRTLNRWLQLGEVPSAVNRTWSRDEIVAWISAGRPSREVWESIRSKQLKRKK